MAQERQRIRLNSYRTAISLIIVLLAFVSTATGYMLWKSYDDTRARSESRAASAAQIVSANASWAFETARQVLRRVDDSLGANLSSPDTTSSSKIADAIATLPGSVKIYVVDAAGQTRLTTDPDFKPIDVRDREYFTAVQKGERWHTSALLVSRLNGEHIFTISKRVERNGAFAGAAILSFNSDLLDGVWRSLTLDRKSTVGLVRSDGQLVSRFPLPNGPMDLSEHVLFTEYLPKAPAGVYQAISPADGVGRIVGYTRVPGTDLIALSSISVEANFRAFWASVEALLAIAIPAGIGLVSVSIWTFRLLARDARKTESEIQFRILAEAMPNHVWTARIDGDLDWFNSRVYEYCGEPEGSLNGDGWTKMVHPDDIDSATRTWNSSIQSSKPYEAEFRLRRQDGIYRHFIARAEPIRDVKGNVTRWIGTNTDIDHQKMMSHQLAESESRLRLAIEAGQLAVWELNTRAMRITPSPELNRLYGFPADANPSIAEYQSRYAPGELERVTRFADESAARGETEFEVEIRHLLPDGTEKWLLVRAQNLAGSNNLEGRLIGVVIDVTARKRFEQELERSERRFRLSQQAAGLGSLELDIATGTVHGSPDFWDIWGLPQQESVHISVLENIVIADHKDIRSNSETRKAGTAIPDVEYQIRRPDNGQLRWLSRHIEFTYDAFGTPLKMFGIIRDITAQKEAQARQEMLMYELEHRIKNILAMVMAIATRTFKNPDIETAQSDFQARLGALGSAHDILTRTRWTQASMAEVLNSSIAPLPKAQISVDGPDIQLQPNMALSMALAVHELGTNALKYGGLSVPEGRVEVSWQIKGGVNETPETLIWTWRETGGPEVSTPTRQGFGSQLIKRVLAADFGGDVEVEYLPQGILVTLVANFSVQKA